MEIQFLKMHGCGDDAVIIDCFKQPMPRDPDLAVLARKILDRARGVGGNSMVVLSPGTRFRVSARCFSTRGDELSVSCNALRCAARYASDSGTEITQEFSIETPQGDTGMEIIDSMNVRADMGIPLGIDRVSEIREKPLESFSRGIVVEGKGITYTPVSFSSSYGIVFVPDFDFPLPRRSRSIIGNPEFPEDTGIGFVQVYNREEIRLRTWEIPHDGHAGARTRRGTENPASCPASGCAVVASVVSGFVDREVFVHLGGGDVYVQWEEGDNRLYLTGPASYVFTGTFYFEEEKA
jgi:diaminopimelate epimerase